MKHTKTTKKLAPIKEVSAEKTTKPAEKVFDITHPGKSMPSASARPVIVSHKPNVSDPMVSPTSQRPKDEGTNEESPAGEGAEIIMAAPKKNRIEPLHTDVTPDEEKSEASTSDKSTSSDKTESQNQEQIEATEASGATTEETSEASEAAAEATAKKEAQTKASKQEAEASKRQAEVEALINNKQFFVPINAVQKRRSKEVVLALVVFIVALVSLLAALDAGLLDIGIAPPTDFIQDNH